LAFKSYNKWPFGSKIVEGTGGHSSIGYQEDEVADNHGRREPSMITTQPCGGMANEGNI